MPSEVTDHDGVRVERNGPVLRVTLVSPANRNAQTPATWRRLASIRDFVTLDVRVVVLTAQGPSFSAGMDRRMFNLNGKAGGGLAAEGGSSEESLGSIANKPPDEMEAFIVAAQSGFTWWGDTHALTIAGVQGYAIGAGFQLALACDMIIAADDAQFAMRETSLGLVPDLTGTHSLVRRIGYSRALEICATGRFVTAQEALLLGLAVAVAPVADLTARTQALVDAVLSAPMGATRELKPLLRAAEVNSRIEQWAAERQAQMNRINDLRESLEG